MWTFHKEIISLSNTAKGCSVLKWTEEFLFLSFQEVPTAATPDQISQTTNGSDELMKELDSEWVI